MNSIIVPEQLNVNLSTGVIVLRVFDRRGQWHIEATFEGGVKAGGTLTADEVNELESRLADLGWRVNPSLCSSGFNARPGLAEDWAMPFASSAGMWVDDYALEATL